MKANDDPRMTKLEPWMASIHTGIFDAIVLAQALVTEAQKTLQDVSKDNEDFLQLTRDYNVAMSIYQGKHQSIDQLLAATQSMVSRSNVPRLHCAQCFAAGVCAISCQRMLDAIPDELQDQVSIVGELQEKARGHFTMWRHLVGLVEPEQSYTAN